MTWRRRRERDFDEEIQSHIALEAERLIADGMPPHEARAAARRAFGDITAARERFHESRRMAWLDWLMQNLRQATRRARAPPWRRR